MANKTRKAKPGSKPLIQHHHLLLRMEMKTCPSKEDKEQAEQLIHNIIRDIHMKLLDKPHVYYVTRPAYNEGLTAIAPIETSHIAFHFWKTPDSKILHNSQSKCLLEFDIYTCGSLSIKQIKRVLHHLSHYVPTHVDITLLNRNWGLSVERHMRWDIETQGSWAKWLDSKEF